MTPEQDIARVITAVCPASGHWPYTHKAPIYIGYRPGEEALTAAADRIIRAAVTYDVVICAERGAAEGMEAMRYSLYAALLEAGWTIEGNPGPEAYDAAAGLFMWPLTVAKGYGVGKDGQPFALRN